MTRDPQTDVCGACQHPYFCSRSEIIGDTVMDTPAKLQEALDGLPKCCNDTLHEHYHVEEIEVPSYQWFTVHLPDTAWENGELERYIRDCACSGSAADLEMMAERKEDVESQDEIVVAVE